MDGAILLVILIPLVSAFIVPIARTDRSAGWISTLMTGVSFLLSLGLLLSGSFGDASLGGFFHIKGDRLGLLISTYILLVSLVVHKFSINYMSDDPGFRRFFVLLDLTTANLLILVTAGNLVLIAMSWSLMGVLVYLMLNHNTRSENAKRFSTYTLITHMIADIPLMTAFFLIYRATGSLTLPEIFSVGGETAALVTVLLILSAAIKSAQFPFHLWIVYSMEGPTPVSALMHAGIVNAGAFLVNRFAPLFVHDQWGLQIAFVIGSVTAVIGSALMLIQNDVKRSLGYSTVGQMGYMIMEIGVGAFALGVYHMMAHGIFKATLFLYSGNVIHNARRDPNVPEDEVYRAVVGSKEVPSRIPWILYGSVTVIVPLTVVVLTHLLVDVNIVKYETALILLFFGWVTGIQVLVSTFRVGRANPLKTVFFVVLSMVVIMLGYAFLGHSLQNFLYPSKDLVDRIYEVAFGSVPVFVAEIMLIGLIILIGWVFLYYVVREKHLPFHLTIYTYLSRELYVPDLYSVTRVYFLKIAQFVSRITFLSAPAPVYAAFAVGDLDLSPIKLIALLVVPVFPISVITALIIRRAGVTGVIALTLLGTLVVATFPDQGGWVHYLAVATMIIHGLRIFRARNLRDMMADLYCGSLPAVWLLPDPVFVILAGSGPLLVGMIEYVLRRRFGTTELRSVRGLIEGAPVVGWLLLISVLHSSGVPPLGVSVVKFSPDVAVGLSVYTLFLLGWFLIGSGSIIRVADIVFGRPREDHIYVDIGLRDTSLLILIIAVSSAVGIGTLWR